MKTQFRKPVIGINGPIGSGKTTISNFLMMELESALIVSFAATLKNMLKCLGVPSENLMGTQTQRQQPLPQLCGKSARDAMQTLGTEWGRETVGQRIWIDDWHRRVSACVHDAVIVDDVRFQNEVDEIRDCGGCVYRLAGREFTGGAPKTNAHASESAGAQGLKGVVSVYNGGSPVDTLRQIISHWNSGGYLYPLKPLDAARYQ